jgi:hypothetical protein
MRSRSVSPHNWLKSKMSLDRWLPLMYAMSDYYADEEERRYWKANQTGPGGKRNIMPALMRKNGTAKLMRWNPGHAVRCTGTGTGTGTCLHHMALVPPLDTGL